jgi:hypothetical protein
MRSHAHCLFLKLVSISISVVALNSPSATHNPQPYGELPRVSIPKPTEAPNFEELRRRQEYGPQRTLIAAPDNTCGFFNGSSGKFLNVHMNRIFSNNFTNSSTMGLLSGQLCLRNPNNHSIDRHIKEHNFIEHSHKRSSKYPML